MEARQSQGREVPRWGSWMAQEPDLVWRCTRPRGGRKSSDAPSLGRLQDNSTVSWGPQEAQDSEWERLTLRSEDGGSGEEGDTAPTWPKGRQISVWEGAEVWVEWSTLKILCLFLSMRVAVEKIEKTALSMA